MSIGLRCPPNISTGKPEFWITRDICGREFYFFLATNLDLSHNLLIYCKYFTYLLPRSCDVQRL